jgi:haloacid dehalogenase-like hydrolase
MPPPNLWDRSGIREPTYAIQQRKASIMKPIARSPGVDRRVLLSSLVMLPVLSASLRSTIAVAQAQPDPLPSWNEGATKASILDFVARVTTQGGPYFVPVDKRIATFDNDGTLWVEQPMYVQLAFILDRVKAMAPMHPEWKAKQPFAAVLDNDFKALAASGERGLVELVAVTHAGMTGAEFEKIVNEWLETARDHRFKRPYTELVYQPMVELLAYLRTSGFTTFIASGGGIEFMRPWTERIYGVRPDQVIGSSIKTRFEMRDGTPVLFRLPDINFIDDKAGKPVGINEHIGGRPIAAFGNSDGDLEMLQWTTLGASGARFGLIVHHTDAEREYAYDRQSHFGKLDVALDAAAVNKWTVVDMKKDWKRIFAFD